ncbi:M56 family metallopeptidase [Teredinibacter waterburyi]|uniref:M56 family metallopeptidase n=1 Tax=Teredinibacter waterburyi TaxID=1500538 RepID=UPI00165F5D35|nr:M56 family metallopeptidase [Teredinibacter waterburyi]
MIVTVNIINALFAVWLKPVATLLFVGWLLARPSVSSSNRQHSFLTIGLLVTLIALSVSVWLPQLAIGVVPSELYRAANLRLLLGPQLTTDLTLSYVLIGAYLLVAISLLISSLRELLDIARLTKVAQLSDNKKIESAAAKLTAHFGLAPGRIRLKQSSEIPSPITWGWKNAVILLPKDASNWPIARLERVLCHEVAHIKRGDWITKLSLRVITSLFWFLPPVWKFSNKINWHAEIACDDSVLSLFNCRAEYAEDLLAISADIKQNSLALGFNSLLYRRIDLILDPSRHRSSVSVWQMCFFAIGVLLLVGPVALLQLDEVTKQEDYLTWLPSPLALVAQESVTESYADHTSERDWKIRQWELDLRKTLSAESAVKNSQDSNKELTGANLTRLDYTVPTRVTAEHTLTVNTAVEAASKDSVDNTARIITIKPKLAQPPLKLQNYQLLQVVAPEYPRSALVRGLEGRVKVVFDVNENGAVEAIRLVEPSEYSVFNRAVITAVEKFKFQPLELNGTPIKTKNVSETFVFTSSD